MKFCVFLPFCDIGFFSLFLFPSFTNCVTIFQTQYIFNQIFRKHLYLASICSKYFIMEFRTVELSEEHKKIHRNTHTHTHTHTHTNTHTAEKTPSCTSCLKMHNILAKLSNISGNWYDTGFLIIHR